MCPEFDEENRKCKLLGITFPPDVEIPCYVISDPNKCPRVLMQK
ncbi:MAG: hypothetical protein ACP6IU_02270 [Candidatus Asgardarchaeia archaeon]